MNSTILVVLGTDRIGEYDKTLSPCRWTKCKAETQERSEQRARMKPSRTPS